MFTVTPYQPTIGKVELVLNDVFRLSRVMGTFPIVSEYTGVSKCNLAKGVVLNMMAIIIVVVSANTVSSDDVLLSEKTRYIFQIIPIVILHLINLVWLVGNSRLVKELYDELKDIEYQLWMNGIDWSYKPSWCIKYLGFTLMVVCLIMWEILYTRFKLIEFHIPQYMTYPSLFSVTSQYLALLQVCLSILKKIRTIEESGAVIQLNDKLLALCQKVNTLYEPQLLAYIFNIFIVILFVIYVKIIQDAPFRIGTVYWIVIYVCPLLQIIFYSGNIHQEIKKMNKMLYRRLLFNLDDEALYFHLVAKRDIDFTVNGFFNLENTLIFSMISTGMDYLIFLIQYM